MKKHSVISTALAITLAASSMFTLTSFAKTKGDIDGDGSVSAADARLALRASVGLESFTDEQTLSADIDANGTVTAADARLILRASVGLETLPELPEEPADIIFMGHKVDSDCIGIEKGITCIDPECECGGSVVMPSFNELVNALKTPGSTNYFYGFTKTVTDTPTPECKANGVAHLALAETMEKLLADSVEPGTTVDYTDLTNHRHINNSTFYVAGTPYISDLKENEVKSVTMEKMTGVDFIKTLPDSYESLSKETYSLTKLKASEIGEVYKVTVTLNPETVTNSNLPEGSTPIEKIINKDYNKGLTNQMNSLDSAFSDMPEMADMFKMEMSITTTAVISYYFTADTFEPVAAHYSVDMDTVSYMHTYFNGLFIKTDKATTTLTIKNDSLQDNYFFFNDFFTVE